MSETNSLIHLDMAVHTTIPALQDIISLPYYPESADAIQVYTSDGLKLKIKSVEGNIVQLILPVQALTKVVVGYPYTMKYTFSEQIFKAKAGNGRSPSNAAKLMIRNCSIYFDETAYFKVKVTPKHRDTHENVFTPDVLGEASLGSLYLDTGFYKFPVFTNAQDTVICIENDSALPSNFQSAEFESFLHSRSSRYA
jgi:hypothetical protein